MEELLPPPQKFTRPTLVLLMGGYETVQRRWLYVVWWCSYQISLKSAVWFKSFWNIRNDTHVRWSRKSIFRSKKGKFANIKFFICSKHQLSDKNKYTPRTGDVSLCLVCKFKTAMTYKKLHRDVSTARMSCWYKWRIPTWHTADNCIFRAQWLRACTEISSLLISFGNNRICCWLLHWKEYSCFE
jgi:hypothetical protein